MSGTPHLPDGLQRMIARYVLDALFEESLSPLIILQCENATEGNHQGLTGDADLKYVCGQADGIVRSSDALVPVGRVCPVDEVESYRVRPTTMASGEIGLMEIEDGGDELEFWREFFPAGVTSCNAVKVPWGASQRVLYRWGWSRATMVTREVRMWKVPLLFEMDHGLGGATAVHVRRRDDNGTVIPTDCFRKGWWMDSPSGDQAKHFEFLTEQEQADEEEMIRQQRRL